MRRDVTLTKNQRNLIMRRAIVTLLAISLLSGVAYAVDPGRAQGAVVIDGNRIDLNYAYAVGNQKNEVKNPREHTRVAATDKPLTDGTKAGDSDYVLPT